MNQVMRSALCLLLVLGAGCRILRVQDPSLTAAHSKRGTEEGFRVGGGYEVDRSAGLFGVGAAGHAGYDSVGNTPVVWAEAHVMFAILSAFGGFWADADGVGPAYGLALAWLMPTCELPEEEENQGPVGALPGGPSCEERRRLVPRLFWRVEPSTDTEDRRVIGIEVVAGWW